jgi:hypothetical protein
MEIKVSGLKTEEEYYEMLRDRIIECVILYNGIDTFHGVDMVRDCARGFLDVEGADQFQFSGEHKYYKHVLEEIYRPLVELGLIVENENNNFSIPDNSQLRDICRIELGQKKYIKWNDFQQTVQSFRNKR